QTGSITGRSGSTTKAAFMDAYNYNFNLGTTDDLITNKYDLNGVNAPKLQFDLAYARYDAGDFDHLQVLVSTDCGSTFPTIVYDKSGSDASGNTLSTRAETTSPFSPTLASEWRLETVDLSAFTGSTVVIKFRFFNGFGNDLFIDNINVSGTPLPVLLESFNAAKAGSTVSLSWKTTVTDKSEVYSIERSSDGINFTEILSMNSISGKNSYQVYDQNALAGMNYYRLKQADENKLFNYSEVVAVDMSPSLNSTMILFPNPVNTGEIFQFEIQGDSNGDLKVFDLSGKPVNVSFERKGSFIEVSVNLNAGVYMVQYSSEGIVRNGKILVK
ncbi:MAG: T9SS type A sorting domain-containing protein, partial [Cytophagaceae bacterium]